jgi:cellulose synthase/poly-beta-1,6-N-acetylglucosamine synthase-like glycosyltransferase
MDFFAQIEPQFWPEVVALYDADHQPCPDSMRIACVCMERESADIVQGRCIIRTGSWLIGLEFDLIYGLFHSGGRLVRGFGIFGGTNGIWRFEALDKIRMNPARLTEDIDSGIRALRSGYKVTYNPLIKSYEEAPPSFNALAKQRLRWAQGWAEVSAYQLAAAFEHNPYLSIRKRFHIFMLLQGRELFPYFVIQATIASIIYLTREPFAWSLFPVLFTLLTAMAFVLPATGMIVVSNLCKGTHVPERSYTSTQCFLLNHAPIFY